MFTLLFFLALQSETVSGARKCENIQVPMCKGLVGYQQTSLPNVFNHTDQVQVYWAMQPFWPFMDIECSKNLRLFLCALYLPKCDSRSSRKAMLPCRETCRKAKVRCAPLMRQQKMAWPRHLRCPLLPPKKMGNCLTPLKEKKKKKKYRYVHCVKNNLSMCKGLPYSLGSLPNTFLQTDQKLMEAEMMQYKPLVNTGCSRELAFFLCGAFMPYCVHNKKAEVPFGIPCRGLCERVYNKCNDDYQRLTGGLPWPGKFHCHRYPKYVESLRWDNRSIPCIQPPKRRK